MRREYTNHRLEPETFNDTVKSTVSKDPRQQHMWQTLNVLSAPTSRSSLQTHIFVPFTSDCDMSARHTVFGREQEALTASRSVGVVELCLGGPHHVLVLVGSVDAPLISTGIAPSSRSLRLQLLLQHLQPHCNVHTRLVPDTCRLYSPPSEDEEDYTPRREVARRYTAQILELGRNSVKVLTSELLCLIPALFGGLLRV